MHHLGPLYAERARLAFAMEHGHSLERDAATAAYPILQADLAQAMAVWQTPPVATTTPPQVGTAEYRKQRCQRCFRHNVPMADGWLCVSCADFIRTTATPEPATPVTPVIDSGTQYCTRCAREDRGVLDAGLCLMCKVEVDNL